MWAQNSLRLLSRSNCARLCDLALRRRVQELDIPLLEQKLVALQFGQEIALLAKLAVARREILDRLVAKRLARHEGEIADECAGPLRIGLTTEKEHRPDVGGPKAALDKAAEQAARGRGGDQHHVAGRSGRQPLDAPIGTERADRRLHFPEFIDHANALHRKGDRHERRGIDEDPSGRARFRACQ
ncbi:hypothetical protein [Cupriavidus sp. UYPR2.512]|uniref:hypothetical protein n=1 Tax=Cupriavidus sp. UYPR2.512 TaxID=1080187 RepID=UPI00037B3A40|nr:hypothetical protein [Cupriavidus sp. UYPR2.512]UIF89013.1 hypothetical protein KAF44_27870 [Cupriavidus necator]